MRTKQSKNEMKNKKFYDIDHARLYLINSIIRIDNNPVMVLDILRNQSSERDIHYRPIENSEGTKIITLSSVRVDMNPVPLGFINFSEFGKKKVAIRGYRGPSRQWRIGLTEENLRIQPQKYDTYTTRKKILKSIFLKNSICGVFPSLKKIIEMIKDKEATSQAFSRDFSIDKAKLMFIQLKDPVGKIFKKEVMLFDDFLYLNQLLEKAIWSK